MSGEIWQLGPLKVQPGQTLRGVFQVDVGVATIDFPIALVNGMEPDPVVLVTAGMDGDEYTAVEAALRLIDALDGTQMAGRVMICPILDPLSFEALHRQNPLDGLFLKHIFPGDLEGKPTQRLAYFIFHNFIETADAWIDLHAAEAGESAIPFTWIAPGDDAQLNEQSEILLRQSGANTALHCPPYAWDPAAQAVAVSTALLVSHAGQSQQIDEDAVEAHLSVVQDVLRGMDMLPGDKPDAPAALYLDAEPVLAGATGVWYPHISPGEDVESGQIIGEVRRLDGGGAIEEITSPVDGVALSVRSGLAARPRLRLALIAHRPAAE